MPAATSRLTAMASSGSSDGETMRRGGSGSLLGALAVPAAVAGDGETMRLGGSFSCFLRVQPGEGLE